MFWAHQHNAAVCPCCRLLLRQFPFHVR
ncbi:MAG: hypothetical protein ACNYZG_09610 [Gammaproteobacteria bacterium]